MAAPSILRRRTHGVAHVRGHMQESGERGHGCVGRSGCSGVVGRQRATRGVPCPPFAGALRRSVALLTPDLGSESL
eukprot:scaffold31514_cov114-Isochrysis_galbana.AAC.2